MQLRVCLVSALFLSLCGASPEKYKTPPSPSKSSSYSSTATLTSSTTRTISLLSIPTSPPPPRIDNNRTLTITNNCTDTLWPGILTANGAAPYTHGFELPGRHSIRLWVGGDWEGRVWGRTNCSFVEDKETKEFKGGCQTGDCSGTLDCIGKTGLPPATLAEFKMTGHASLSYYDISLVDGYSLDMMIIPEHNPPAGSGTKPEDLSPACIATTPEKEGQQFSRWCPWDLQQNPPDKQGGISPAFWQPDDHIQRPFFNPCLSACAAWGKESDCCAGEYNDPEKCKPSLYSRNAKAVCKDAYSYAYDDKLSTFTVPTGEGFEIVFCPGGASTNIMERLTGAHTSSSSSLKVRGMLMTMFSSALVLVVLW